VPFYELNFVNNDFNASGDKKGSHSVMCLHDSHDPYFWTEENTGVKHRLLREGTYRLEGC